MPDIKFTDLAGMKFDDGGDPHPDEAPVQQAAPEPKEDVIPEPNTMTFKVFKLLSENPGATRSELAVMAKEKHDIPYERVGAALYDCEVRNRIRADRTVNPVKFYPTMALSIAKQTFNQSPPQNKPKAFESKPASAYRTKSEALYELIKEYPNRTTNELGILAKRRRIGLNSLTSTITRFEKRGYVKITPSGARGGDVVEPLKEGPYLAKGSGKGRRARAKPAPVNIDAVHTKRVVETFPNPAPIPPEAVKPEPKTLSPEIVYRGAVQQFTGQQIVDMLTIKQAREVFDVLKGYFGG